VLFLLAVAETSRSGCRRAAAQMTMLDKQWGMSQQQDAHELLDTLLQKLQAETNRVKCKPAYCELTDEGSVAEQAKAAAASARGLDDSFVDDVFGGLLQSTTRCVKCGYKRHCFDACCALSVPIPATSGTSSSVSVAECLAKFSEDEVLDHVYTCAGCKAQTVKIKRMQLFTPPSSLILTLKRFASRGEASLASFGGNTPFGLMSKNSTAVDVPAMLDLRPYCSAEGLEAAGASGRYELVAVSEHSGSMQGGHYTATGRAVSDGAWYQFDDARVSKAAVPTGLSTAAYILFFRMLPLD
jgi:ubiquitin C-terminal hydrolase